MNRLSRFCLLACAAGLAIAVLGCRDKSQSASRQGFEKRVRSKNDGLFSGFHGNERITLVIDGAEFPRVMGTPPYYLKLPNTNAIFFQTAEAMHGTYHVYFFDNRTHISVRADTTVPGGSIGLSGQENNKVWVESFQTNMLVVGNRFLEVQGHHYIDLVQRKVLKEEVWVFDREYGGRITNHVTYKPPIGY